MSNVEFLRKYIEENPNICLEDVLTDEEFLEELQKNKESFLKYLSKYFNKLKEFLIVEPSIVEDYNRAYKFPYLSCEIFLTISPIFKDIFFQEDNNILNDLLLFLTKNSENSILIGYCERIILKYIKFYQNEMKNYFIKITPILKIVLMRCDNDSICDICYKILTIPINSNSKEFEILRKELFGFISQIFIDLLEEGINQKLKTDFSTEIMVNITSIFIRILDFLITNENYCENYFEIIFNEHIFSKIESIYKLYNSETPDSKISINFNNIKVIENLNYLLSQIAEKVLTKDYIIANDSSDYSELFENNSIIKSEKIDNMNEVLIENKNLPLNKESLKNLFQILSNSIKEKLTSFYIKNFPTFLETNLVIKNFVKDTKKIPNTNGSYISPVGKCYLFFIEMIEVLILSGNINVYQTLMTNTSLFSILIIDFMEYNHNSFLQNKILKIFQIIFKINSFNNFIIHLIKNNHFNPIISINYDLFINKEKKCLNNKIVNKQNIAHIISLLYCVDFFINENKELKENYDKIENISNLRLNLQFYLNISTKSLLSTEIQSINDLKNSGDEKITFEKNFYDSEAFLSTSMKTLENSKKMNFKLKQLDDVLAKK